MIGPSAVLAALVVSVLIAVRRRVPLLVLAAATALQVLTFTALLTLPVAAFTAASRVPRRTGVPALLASAVAVGVAAFQYYPDPFGALFYAVVLVLAPAGFALYLRQRRELLAALTDRAERAERERDLRARQARADERTRIAREMHDVVAHRMSLVVLHAGALGTAAHDPARTADTAELIRQVGHQALGELRAALTVLRSEPGGAPAPRTPLPTIGEVEGLVAQSRTAGLAVDLRIEGSPVPVDLPIGRAVHGVVREALTNLHKHAPSAPASVVLAYAADGVEVAVRNGAPRTPPPPLPSGGAGLLGLAERVRLVGGRLHAGPTADGGFAVVAALPLSAPLGLHDEQAEHAPEAVAR